MQYVENTAHYKTMEAQGWKLLHDLLTNANLTEEQWFCVHLALDLALGFPVMNEEATATEEAAVRSHLR